MERLHLRHVYDANNFCVAKAFSPNVVKAQMMHFSDYYYKLEAKMKVPTSRAKILTYWIRAICARMYLVYQLLGRHMCIVVPCSAHRRSYTIEQAHLSFQLCRYCRVLVTHNQHCNIGGASRASKVTGTSPVGGYTWNTMEGVLWGEKGCSFG